jgi:6-phosphogluconolactonase
VKARALPDAAAVADEGARVLVAEARAAIASRGRFLVALSGGRTPWAMLRAFAAASLPWDAVHVFQVDERFAPEGDPARNSTHLRACFLDRTPPRPVVLHPMPVDDATDPEAAARAYERTLEGVAGRPVALDLVQLGLGTDGHTASLVPGDRALAVADRDVAATGVHAGHRRLTLTYPTLDRARRVIWVVTGEEKAAMLARLLAGDPSIPAGRVRRDDALVLHDRPASPRVG